MAFSKVLSASRKLALMHITESGLLSGVVKQQQELAQKLKEAEAKERFIAAAHQSGDCRRLFSRPALCAALGPGHRLNTGSAAADAADRATLKALLLAFIPFFSSGARFDVFSRRRTGCGASLLRKGNAAHEEGGDRAKRQRSVNDHEAFLPFL
jgi:hypothetical protein